MPPFALSDEGVTTDKLIESQQETRLISLSYCLFCKVDQTTLFP